MRDVPASTGDELPRCALDRLCYRKSKMRCDSVPSHPRLQALRETLRVNSTFSARSSAITSALETLQQQAIPHHDIMPSKMSKAQLALQLPF